MSLKLKGQSEGEGAGVEGVDGVLNFDALCALLDAEQELDGEREPAAGKLKLKVKVKVEEQSAPERRWW